MVSPTTIPIKGGKSMYEIRFRIYDEYLNEKESYIYCKHLTFADANTAFSWMQEKPENAFFILPRKSKLRMQLNYTFAIELSENDKVIERLEKTIEELYVNFLRREVKE